MSDNYIEVTHENFAEKVLRASGLVIVNFSTEQSNVSKIQEPEFEAVSKEYHDKITFAKLNVTGQDAFTSQWTVDSVPTMLFFKDGAEIYRITGIVMRARLRRQLEGILHANESRS